MIVSDDFNRADGLLGANWSAWNQVGDNPGVISTQKFTGQAAAQQSGNVWAANAFPADQFSQVELAAAIGNSGSAAGDWLGACVRADAGFANGYVLIYFFNTGSPGLWIFRRDAGTFTALGAILLGTLNVNDVIRLEAHGTTLRAMVNGNELFNRVDATYSAGSPGVGVFGQPLGDNWQGGDFATAVGAFVTRHIGSRGAGW